MQQSKFSRIEAHTVNSEIFVRVLFLQNFAYVKFRENKIFANDEITLSPTDVGNHALVPIF